MLASIPRLLSGQDITWAPSRLPVAMTAQLLTRFSFSHLIGTFLTDTGWSDVWWHPWELWQPSLRMQTWCWWGHKQVKMLPSLSRVQGGLSHICRTFLHTEMYLVTLGTKGIFLLTIFRNHSFTSSIGTVETRPCCLQGHYSTRARKHMCTSTGSWHRDTEWQGEEIYEISPPPSRSLTTSVVADEVRVCHNQ